MCDGKPYETKELQMTDTALHPEADSTQPDDAGSDSNPPSAPAPDEGQGAPVDPLQEGERPTGPRAPVPPVEPPDA